MKNYADRPSARLAAKSGWGNSGSMRGGRGTTAFSRAYARGDVSRYFTLNHGSIKHSLDWRTPPDELPYHDVLPLCVEGLCELDHPFVFLARQSVIELMRADGAGEKIEPLLPQVTRPLRAALSSQDEGMRLAALAALVALSEAVGPALNGSLQQLVPQVHRISFARSLHENAFEALHALAENGGDEAVATIKKKVPTFQ